MTASLEKLSTQEVLSPPLSNSTFDATTPETKHSVGSDDQDTRSDPDPHLLSLRKSVDSLEKAYSRAWSGPEIDQSHAEDLCRSRDGEFSVFSVLNELESNLSSVKADLLLEHDALGSTKANNLVGRIEHCLFNLGELQYWIRRPTDIGTNQFIPDPVLPYGSPTEARVASDLTAKIDDLLARLKEATNVPPDCFSARGESAREPTGVPIVDDNQGSKGNASPSADRASQLEAEVRILKAQLATYQPTPLSALMPQPLALSSATPNYEDLHEEARLKWKWLEAMQQGSWFYRIARRFGALGKALGRFQRRRVFLWLTSDFKSLAMSSAEPEIISPSENDKDNKTLTTDLKVLYFRLETVDGFDYGATSRSFRLLEEARCEKQHPAHLCFSLNMAKTALDLIGLNDTDVERWVLGLNSLVPFFPGRQCFTPEEFARRRASLRKEYFRSMDPH